jgi:hypothetical protein
VFVQFLLQARLPSPLFISINSVAFVLVDSERLKLWSICVSLKIR